MLRSPLQCSGRDFERFTAVSESGSTLLSLFLRVSVVGGREVRPTICFRSALPRPDFPVVRCLQNVVHVLKSIARVFSVLKMGVRGGFPGYSSRYVLRRVQGVLS